MKCNAFSYFIIAKTRKIFVNVFGDIIYSKGKCFSRDKLVLAAAIITYKEQNILSTIYKNLQLLTGKSTFMANAVKK